MPFGRRNKANFFLFIKNNIKILFSFNRTKKYFLLNLKRMKGSSHDIAIGLASGIAVSFTPFLGLHALLGITLAWILRGSMAAALVGTLFGNPWTFPFIWYLSYEIGKLLISDTNILNAYYLLPSLKDEMIVLFILIKNIFLTTDYSLIKDNFNSLKFIPIMALGSIPMAVISWFFSYFVFESIINSYKNKLLKKK
ncbi:MAG: hypothetical protein CFH34_01128 [Alphaproteobacteria bacterium MarineAlpha9_Bin4]|nr:hypothetical protein [Pelagibacterales bacterium]PPR26132.1 MAG: hypothetical protein CFH34_01128 [Alphaproteobacteria bacterium MarineAlpha9_Bin4]